MAIKTKKKKILTRPTGTPKSENVDVTNMTPLEREKEQRRSALQGMELQRIKEENIRNQAIARMPSVFPPGTKREEQPEMALPPTKEELEEPPTNVYPEGSFPQKIAKTLRGTDVQQKKVNFKSLGEVAIKPIAEVYQFVESIFRGGKGIKQRAAESAFADVKVQINSGVMDVKTGLKDPSEVKKDIILAEKVNNKLEKSAKSLSAKTIRYFITDGIDVGTEVLINREYLQDMRMALFQAEQTAMAQAQVKQLATAKAGYGL